jgi:formiminotetrahydrofolate cyclodeaminase
VETEDYLDLRIDDFLDRLAEGGRAPGGGSAAALSVAFAAGLVAMVARCSRGSWDDATGVAAQSLAIKERAAQLARTDADAWQQASAALGEAGGDGDPEGRDRELEQKLGRAAAVPLEIAELGADAAALAALVGEYCEGAYRADAAAAAALASGGASAAAHLVQVNLTVQEGDERLKRARASEQAAAESAKRTLASIR